ncbi:hypothetical protein AB0J21_10520 [Streptomyces sp. NPDC049954]|uniref:hypothetical protein n=1 Tax=Streptomyces sp. NPDC049954 TaxID=3155779 RepID=UPI00342CDCB3
MVIILDDATGPGQVGPLLPSGSPSLTIIASRRHLTGIPQALSVPLDVLPEEDAIALFRGFAGEERTRDIAGTARIVGLCGFLPLAIELVAHRFRARTSWTLGILAERLTRSTRRLAEIHSADQEQEMTRSFALSYRTLTAQQRAAFRCLGMHPEADFTADAAAAMLGLPLDTTERILEGLLAFQLLGEPVPDRYRYHDLLREYAYGLSIAEDSEQERRRAADRLTSFYITKADLADRMAYPRRVRLNASTPLLPTPSPPLPDAAATERGNLLAVADHARHNGEPGRLPGSAPPWPGSCSRSATGRTPRGSWGMPSSTGAGRTRCAPSLCRALIDLCAAEASIGDYSEAAAAGELARALGDGPAEAEDYGSLAH